MVMTSEATEIKITQHRKPYMRHSHSTFKSTKSSDCEEWLMHPRISTEFCITGTQIQPEEITELIGVLPSRIWKVGESIQNTALRRKHNGWCLMATVDADELDLAKSAQGIFQLLLPKAKIINEICDKFDLNCELSYAIYIIDETPIIHFEQDTQSALMDLNATVDIDIILMRKK